ncbi:MATE family efflux transporter [Phascolarctobacterium faecium]|nr:MATE family efflux transporter [Phascolarctobacterium faecium]MDM8109535.1 MATE family efflux transporter [Phascolarctobacterium faecium]
MLGKKNAVRLRRLLDVMIPILITQTAIMAMNFCDSAMSGHAGAVHLAGTAIGGNLWMPVMASLNGILLGSMPIIAHLLGRGERQNIGRVVRHTMLLATAFSLLLLVVGVLFLDRLLGTFGLEPQVHYIAKMYIAAIGVGVLPFFLSTALRALVDTSGYTGITMKIYLLALPVNAFLNYCLIFGKFGAPALGGIGAGLATGITYWLEFFIFVWVVHKLPAFAPLRIFTDKFKFDMAQLRENLSLGVPMGMAIFMEASIFGVIAIFIAKFGTVIIAAHQAAMSFTSLLYMVPLSFSMSLTIVVGVEAGARRFGEALRYSLLGIACNITVAVMLTIFVLFDREFIAGLYTSEPVIIRQTIGFLFYAMFFQVMDATAAPIQGILRGYKDVKATFWAGLAAYWLICLPLGCYFDYYMHLGPSSYWLSLDIGLLCAVLFLGGRFWYLQRKIKINGGLE